MDFAFANSMASGVYAIEHVPTGRLYIGSSVNMIKRWQIHKWHLNRGSHHSSHLQRAWDKYGPDQFVFGVLESCSENELVVREQNYLDLKVGVFNTCPRAGSVKGLKHTDAARANMKAARAKRGEITDEARRRMSLAQRARFKREKVARETIRKMKLAQKKRMSDPTIRAAISAALTGKPHSEERKQNIRNGLRRRYLNEPR